MEDPASWNPIVKLISETIYEQRRQAENLMCGYSLPMSIYVALVKAGHIQPPR